ncbi:CcdB family protein [Sphingomonas oligophenolica]|uniref:Toxin CcdB n=1 Tax=Sphingomonas oligophenolica TaxID=301154 RepID=A0A502CQE2_9SPHN|nr:CcdB family protein [Sphingomonas oligophenolica]TPG15447.1 hypothetical protein EAH84_01155 [Sphingomonas oligophenolica]
MAQFDVYRLSSGDVVVDCQTDQLWHLATRVVVPLFADHEGVPPNARLNAAFPIDGAE